mmetsp:Transcript_37054/g.110639  ORF Transcript_37054/g.110639 Transcript_37054/m.110639 type:complete len:177 (+) Transcript_37054:46-576(+)
MGLCGAGSACTSCEEEPPGPRPDWSPFVGRWTSSKGNRHLVGLGGILWADGAITPLRVQQGWLGGGPTCWVNHRGTEYSGKLLGETLQWSDGDVWTRESAGMEPATETARQCGLSPVAIKRQDDRSCALNYEVFMDMFDVGGGCAGDRSLSDSANASPAAGKALRLRRPREGAEAP